jgi:uncharacterized protein YegL
VPTEQRKRVAAAIVLDESGSMQAVRMATISGVNEWLQDQRSDASTEMDVCLVKFGSLVHGNLTVVPIRTFAELTPESYQPNGWTALLDAMGTAIKQLESHDADAYLVLVVTDGLENFSKEFTPEKIREMVTQKEATGVWSFTFLGANIDAWAAAQGLGFQHSNVANFAQQNVTNTFRAASAGMSRGREIVANSAYDASGLLRSAGGEVVFSAYSTADEVIEQNADVNPGRAGRSTTD